MPNAGTSVLARALVIRPNNVTKKPIQDVKAGDVLTEGVVIATHTQYPRGTRSRSKPVVYLDFVHNTTIAEEEGTQVEVLARLADGMVETIREAMGKR